MRRFSQSEFKEFQCNRRWWLSSYRRLSPITLNPSGPLRSGSRVHTGLEALYGPNPETYLDALKVEQDADWQAYLDNCTELGVYPDVEVSKAFDKDSELERAMLEGYADWVAESGVDAGIEARQPQRHAHRIGQSEHPAEARPVLQRPEIDAHEITGFHSPNGRRLRNLDNFCYHVDLLHVAAHFSGPGR